jgi:hypothetical protein
MVMTRLKVTGWAGVLVAIMLLAAPSQASAQGTNFMARDHLVIDLRFGIEWLRCTVGTVWNGETCVGQVVRLSQDDVEIAIRQANEQLGEGWRLPTLEELEALVCDSCGTPMINADMFPDTPSEPYWTGETNAFSSRHYYSVNFFNGWTFGRFLAGKPLAVRLVRDRN